MMTVDICINKCFCLSFKCSYTYLSIRFILRIAPGQDIKDFSTRSPDIYVIKEEDDNIGKFEITKINCQFVDNNVQ